jgi:hypothetical protein
MPNYQVEVATIKSQNGTVKIIAYRCTSCYSRHLLMHHTQRHCHFGEPNCQAGVRNFSSEQIPVTLSALQNKIVYSPFVLVQWIRSELSPFDRRNTQVWSWAASESCVSFLGRGELCDFDCILCQLVFGSNWKHHVSSPEITISDIYALCKRSDEVRSRRCFCSSIKIRGTNFAEILLTPKFSLIICQNDSIIIFNSSTISLTLNLPSKHPNVCTLSASASLILVFGCPLLGSSCTFSRPSLRCVCLWKHSISFYIIHHKPLLI